MRVVKSFNLKDIREYELKTGDSLLEVVQELTIDNVIKLIILGNNKCNETMAFNILDKALESKTLLEVHSEIKECLFGRGMEDGEKGIDVSSKNNLTEVFMDIGMNLMTVGVNYSEFWAMNTVEMHQVFNSLVIKIKTDTDRRLSEYHSLASMVGAAVWGKLPKDAPVMELKDKALEGEDDAEFIRNYGNLMKLVAKYGG